MDKEALLVDSFKKVFEEISQEGIKESVDRKGIKKFSSDCAGLAGLTGAASGFGGFSTILIGVPVDVLNNIVQQFRVTLGIIYHKKGVYNISFEEFMKIVGVSLGVEIGASVTKVAMFSIARSIIAKLSVSTAGKAIPFVGAFIGGSVNYGFIKAIAAAVNQINMEDFHFETA